MKINIKEYLGDKTFYKNVAVITIPIAMQSLINIGVNMMSTIMLAKMGEIQLSASSLANQFLMLFQICCMGIGMGASVLTSRFWGMGNKQSLKKSITLMLWLCVVIGALFTVATIFAPQALISIYLNSNVKAQETNIAIIDAGVRYFKWIAPTYLLAGLSLTCTIVLRSVGSVRLPLISSIVSFFISIFFNWVFIFGNLGAPRMEIEGAALGVLIARFSEFIFICGYFFLFEKKIRYRFKDLFMNCRDVVREYFTVSIPVFISDLILALGNNATAMVMGRVGHLFVAANTITTVVLQLSTVFIQGMSNASAIITGHTLGEGNTDKAQKQGVTFFGLGVAIGVFAGAFIMLISKAVINFYDVSNETRIIAEELMIALGIIVVFQSANSILTKGVLRGGGDTKFLMIADVLFLWIASVPLGYLAGIIWGISPFWIYIFLKIDQIIKAVWCVFRLYSRKWIKRI